MVDVDLKRFYIDPYSRGFPYQRGFKEESLRIPVMNPRVREGRTGRVLIVTFFFLNF